MEVPMARRDPDRDWREHVLSTLPPVQMEATGQPAATSLTPATATDFAPTIFRGDRTPDDPAVLLDGQPLVKMAALRQRALDLHAQIPSFSEISELRLTRTGHANRIAHLMKHKSDGGFGLSEGAAQVQSEQKKLQRVEQELVRQETLREVRTVRWNAAGQLERSVTDWLLRGGIPGDCVLEAVEDAPISELLTKQDDGRVDAAVERLRLRLRELGADAHRVRSSPWPSSMAKAAAKELIDRLADQGAPDLDGAIEFGQPISFAQMTLRSIVRNIDGHAIAHAEAADSIGLMCWLFRDQMIAKINAGFDEIADDKVALGAQQREEMEAQINSDMLSIERSECSLVWHAAEGGEIIDFRPLTTPAAAIGVALRSVPRGDQPQSSWMHAYDVVQPGGGRP
jgi:hypothetical protein